MIEAGTAVESARGFGRALWASIKTGATTVGHEVGAAGSEALVKVVETKAATTAGVAAGSRSTTPAALVELEKLLLSKNVPDGVATAITTALRTSGDTAIGVAGASGSRLAARVEHQAGRNLLTAISEGLQGYGAGRTAGQVLEGTGDIAAKIVP